MRQKQRDGHTHTHTHTHTHSKREREREREREVVAHQCRAVFCCFLQNATMIEDCVRVTACFPCHLAQELNELDTRVSMRASETTAAPTQQSFAFGTVTGTTGGSSGRSPTSDAIDAGDASSFKVDLGDGVVVVDGVSEQAVRRRGRSPARGRSPSRSRSKTPVARGRSKSASRGRGRVTSRKL